MSTVKKLLILSLFLEQFSLAYIETALSQIRESTGSSEKTPRRENSREIKKSWTALFSRDLDINKKNKDGTTSLMRAARKGVLNKIKKLLLAKADVNIKDSSGQTALFYAAMNKKWDVMSELIKAHATGEAALFEAIRHAKLDIVKEYLNFCKPDSENLYGRALVFAASIGQWDIVREFLAAKINPNIKSPFGETALYWAAGAGQLDMVKELLIAKADINAKASNGLTAIGYAKFFNNQAIIKIIGDWAIINQIPILSSKDMDILDGNYSESFQINFDQRASQKFLESCFTNGP
jgi:ankyrin repeat protein